VAGLGMQIQVASIRNILVQVDKPEVELHTNLTKVVDKVVVHQSQGHFFELCIEFDRTIITNKIG
jgi:hypothetical protein